MAFNGFVSPVVIQIHPTLAKLRKFFSKSSEVVRLIAKHFLPVLEAFIEKFSRENSQPLEAFRIALELPSIQLAETVINFQPFQDFLYASP